MPQNGCSSRTNTHSRPVRVRPNPGASTATGVSLPIAPSGAGDVIAALFLFHRLRCGAARPALEAAAASVFGLLRRTVEAGAPELLVVAAQEEQTLRIDVDSEQLSSLSRLLAVQGQQSTLPYEIVGNVILDRGTRGAFPIAASGQVALSMSAADR